MAPPKRKAVASPAGDTKLQRVMHALEMPTSEGALFASGSSEQFPCPAIAFRGDNDELFPLRQDDAQKIKARATVPQTTANVVVQGVQNVWEVDGDALVSHNWRWLKFLDDRVTSMRPVLSIPPTAVVNVSLKKLMLVEAGGSLCVRRGSEEERGEGVFGTLLVVLPGAFKGGAYVVDEAGFEEDDDYDEEDEDDYDEFHSHKRTWRPNVRGSDYDMSYAVCYDHCTYVAEPVTQGTALCLVYDLVTPTPNDIPLFVGVQRAINASLNDFFDVVPKPLVKRCKISDDAWRTVNEFALERHFVYRVDGDTFSDLYGENMEISERLASFCAQSRGRYALYFADVVYSRVQDPSVYRYGRILKGREWNVTLKAPWLKYGGNSEGFQCPPIFLRPRDEIAPYEHLDEGHWYHIDDAPASARAIAKKLHGQNTVADVHWTNALVVLPASVEARQLAKLPIQEAMLRLHRLLADSRDDALQYARHIVHNRPAWHVRSRDMDHFTWFVRMIREINDRQLFNDLLLTVDLERSDDGGALSSAVKHYGWSACADAIVKRILSTPTSRGRINWVLSVCYAGMDPVQIDQMLLALVSLYPWTETKVDPNEAFDEKTCHAQIIDFKRLLTIANRSSPQILAQVGYANRVVSMLRIVVPVQIIPGSDHIHVFQRSDLAMRAHVDWRAR